MAASSRRRERTELFHLPWATSLGVTSTSERSSSKVHPTLKAPEQAIFCTTQCQPLRRSHFSCGALIGGGGGERLFVLRHDHASRCGDDARCFGTSNAWTCRRYGGRRTRRDDSVWWI